MNDRCVLHTIAHSFLSVEIKHLNLITYSQLHVSVTCMHVIEDRGFLSSNCIAVSRVRCRRDKTQQPCIG